MQNSSHENSHADKVLIRRLQNENTRLVEEHTKIQKSLHDEICALKEAYQICMANYEREAYQRNSTEMFGSPTIS